MNQHLVPYPGPYIDTQSTRQLLTELDYFARRRGDVAATMERIRGGDDEYLLGILRQSQSGDREATVVVLGAMLPVLCKIVLNRCPQSVWETAIDDYIGLATLTILDLHATPRFHLLERLAARTRRRYERQFENRSADVTPSADLSVAPDNSDLETRVLARIKLRAVCHAVRAGSIPDEHWARLRAVAAAEGSDESMPGRQRQALWRARRALERCPELQAAA